jgi:hypothetical protein
MSDSPMFDAISAIFDAKRPPSRFLFFPPGGPLESHVGVPEQRIDCDGGHYVLSYVGQHAAGYEWKADA